MREVETIVVGGGPAGAAAACALAAGGRGVVLLERSAAAHHKVCGEFLSVETQHVLCELGIDPVSHGAVPIDEVTIHVGRRHVSARLPFRALSLSRHRLDQALLARAEQAGARIHRGVAVQAVAHDGGHWEVRCNNGEPLRSRHLIVATGKQGLRGISDSRDGSLVGLKMHLRLPVSVCRNLERRVALFMLDRCYVGLEAIEDGKTNLCLVMRRDLAAHVGAGWPTLRDHLRAASQQLVAALEKAEPLFDKPLAVVCPQGGHVDDEAQPMAYRVGDRFAHVPPFTGDGLAIALTSGSLAASHILQGRGPAEYLATARRIVGRPIHVSGAISVLAGNRAGRAMLIGAAMVVPGLIGTVVRQTRLPVLPMQGQDVSYAPFRA
jgi:flavin-dependent dehydrogenase